MLVHAHDRGIDRCHPVQVPALLRETLHVFQDPRPHASFGPEVEVFGLAGP